MNKHKSTDLKTRINVAFLCVIIIPIILCAVTFFLLLSFKARSLGKQYGIEHATVESLYNSTLLISSGLDEQLQNIEKDVAADPTKIEDKEYLDSVNTELGKTSGVLIVLKGDDVYYNGSAYSDLQIVKDIAGSATQVEGSASGENLSQVKNNVLYKSMAVTFPDNEAGTVIAACPLNQIPPSMRLWLIEMVLLIILILTLTSLAMSFWIYRGVIEPIDALKKATQNIRDGNLDFSLSNQECGVREINELCQDFDEMRIRLKESAEEKVQFDKQSKDLISNISHDLKTPVTAIRGYVEGIMDGVADTPEKMDRYVRTIYNKTNDVTRLLDELTTYSKIDTNRIPYNFTKIRISDYFEDCVEDISMDLESRGIKLTYFNYLQKSEYIIADPEQLRRVVNNIIGNSIKYMDKEKGAINIRLRDVGDFVQVEIEDNGRGIAQADITRIFDRFYRSDSSRNSRGGSGIGLSIVKKILEDHEGKVWASSKEGVGTTIYFVLRKYREETAQDMTQETTGDKKYEQNSDRRR